jgi:hypothetical protein
MVAAPAQQHLQTLSLLEAIQKEWHDLVVVANVLEARQHVVLVAASTFPGTGQADRRQLLRHQLGLFELH